MTQSILAFYSENVWSKDHTRHTQKTLHWVLQAIGSTAALIGMLLEVMSKIQNGRDHFYSPHAICGLVAGIFTFIGMMNGVAALWSVELRKYGRPLYFKLAHNLTGLTAFVMGKESALFFF